MVVTMVAVPVGMLGVAGLYVKSLVMVTAHVIVAMPVVPTLLHWVIGVEAALARFASNMITANPTATDSTSNATKTLRGKAATRVIMRGLSFSWSGVQNQAAAGDRYFAEIRVYNCCKSGSATGVMSKTQGPLDSPH